MDAPLARPRLPLARLRAPSSPSLLPSSPQSIRERPSLKPLVLVLKHFLVTRNLDKPYLGGLSSYGVLLLVLRFLQARQGRAFSVHFGPTA